MSGKAQQPKEYIRLESHNGKPVSNCLNASWYYNGEEPDAKAVIARMQREGGYWFGSKYVPFSKLTEIEILTEDHMRRSWGEGSM